MEPAKPASIPGFADRIATFAIFILDASSSLDPSWKTVVKWTNDMSSGMDQSVNFGLVIFAGDAAVVSRKLITVPSSEPYYVPCFFSKGSFYTLLHGDDILSPRSSFDIPDGTNYHSALQCCSTLMEDLPRYKPCRCFVYFLTDGLPSGTFSHKQIIATREEKLPDRDCTFITIGVGGVFSGTHASAPKQLLEAMATKKQGKTLCYTANEVDDLINLGLDQPEKTLMESVELSLTMESYVPSDLADFTFKMDLKIKKAVPDMHEPLTVEIHFNMDSTLFSKETPLCFWKDCKVGGSTDSLKCTLRVRSKVGRSAKDFPNPLPLQMIIKSAKQHPSRTSVWFYIPTARLAEDFRITTWDPDRSKHFITILPIGKSQIGKTSLGRTIASSFNESVLSQLGVIGNGSQHATPDIQCIELWSSPGVDLSMNLCPFAFVDLWGMKKDDNLLLQKAGVSQTDVYTFDEQYGLINKLLEGSVPEGFKLKEFNEKTTEEWKKPTLEKMKPDIFVVVIPWKDVLLATSEASEWVKMRDLLRFAREKGLPIFAVVTMIDKAAKDNFTDLPHLSPEWVQEVKSKASDLSGVNTGDIFLHTNYQPGMDRDPFIDCATRSMLLRFVEAFKFSSLPKGDSVSVLATPFALSKIETDSVQVKELGKKTAEIKIMRTESLINRLNDLFQYTLSSRLALNEMVFILVKVDKTTLRWLPFRKMQMAIDSAFPGITTVELILVKIVLPPSLESSLDALEGFGTFKIDAKGARLDHCCTVDKRKWIIQPFQPKLFFDEEQEPLYLRLKEVEKLLAQVSGCLPQQSDPEGWQFFPQNLQENDIRPDHASKKLSLEGQSLQNPLVLAASSSFDQLIKPDDKDKFLEAALALVTAWKKLREEMEEFDQ